MPNVAQDMIAIKNLVKEIYIPYLDNHLNVDADPFLSKIPKAKLEGDSGTFSTRIGVAGNVGMSEERAPTPISKAPLYSRMKFTSKDAYVELAISNKTIQLGRTNKAVMRDAVADYMTASYEAAEWNMGRMVYGNGTGVLGTIVASASATNKLTMDSVANVITGITVDVYTFTTGGEAQLTTTNSKVQIIAVNPRTNEITLSDAVTAATASGSAYGFITMQNSYGREITGLGAIFDTSVKEIYGVNKDTEPLVLPQYYDAENNIDDVKLTKAVRAASNMYGAEIDMILCGDNAFDAYEYYMKTSNVSVVEKREFVGGARGYSVVVGSREVEIVNAKHVPANKIWGVDTNLFEFRETGWDFADYEGSPFVLKAGTSEYRGLLANYCELVCKNPGAMFEIDNANDAA